MVPPPLSRGNGVCNRGMREDRRCTVKHRVDAIARSPAYLAERSESAAVGESNVRRSRSRTQPRARARAFTTTSGGSKCARAKDVRGASAFVSGQAGFGDVPQSNNLPFLL